MNARLLILAYVTGLTVGASAKDDASLEGVVKLPPPTVERALSQRYGTSVEAPLTPSNPPAAVVISKAPSQPTRSRNQVTSRKWPRKICCLHRT